MAGKGVARKMITVFCKLEKIGGIGGKRVMIRKINKVKEIEIRPRDVDIYISVIKPSLVFEDTCDTLKVADDKTDLDRFMELQKEQPNIKYDRNGRHYFNSEDYITLLEFDKGEVVKFGLIKIKDVLEKIPSGDLKKGNYPFNVIGLYAHIK